MHPPVLALPDLRIAVRLSSLRAIYLRGPFLRFAEPAFPADDGWFQI